MEIEQEQISYEEALEKVGEFLVVQSSDNFDKDQVYISNMTECHFHRVNHDNCEGKFTLVGTADNVYTFHMKGLFITNLSVKTHLDNLLATRFNIKQKWQALQYLSKNVGQ